MYRQGDVLIMEAQPSRGDRKPAADNILVYGEATGHAHRVQSESAKVFDTFAGKEIDAPKGFALVHEEHATIEIPEGYYRVRRQREFDEKEIRYVAD
jgi:hypothetical protein